MRALRLVLLVVTLALVAFVARRFLLGPGEPGPGAPTSPAGQLERTREAVRGIEATEQQQADRADVKE